MGLFMCDYYHTFDIVKHLVILFQHGVIDFNEICNICLFSSSCFMMLCSGKNDHCYPKYYYKKKLIIKILLLGVIVLINHCLRRGPSAYKGVCLCILYLRVLRK